MLDVILNFYFASTALSNNSNSDELKKHWYSDYTIVRKRSFISTPITLNAQYWMYFNNSNEQSLYT